MSIVVLQTALVILLLFLSSVFSGSETALFSLKPYQVRELQRRPSKGSIMVGSLLKDPYHLLVTILIGNTLVNVAAASIGTSVVGRFVEQGVVGISVATMTVLILIFGEIVPKTIAVSNPLRISLAAAPSISLAVRLLTPVKGILESLIRLFLRRGPMGHPGLAGPAHEHVTEAIAVGHSEGVLDKVEMEVLGGILRLMHLSVQNIMTPRTEVFMLRSDLTVADAVSLVKSSGYSRIPVFDGEKRDSVTGILYVKDLLNSRVDSGTAIGDVAREPFFVPESKSLVDLLDEFVSGSAHFAVAIDEYGTFTGIVTLDDILGEVVGTDASRRLEKHRYRHLSRSRWEVSGRMEIKYFNALVGAAISDAHADTIAGFIIDRMGKIPAPGEELVVKNLKLRVLDADGRRIKSVEIEKLRKQGRSC
ncbi:MAG: hemolysin family protein [Candidatus Eisenbacteria bacterium]